MLPTLFQSELQNISDLVQMLSQLQKKGMEMGDEKDHPNLFHCWSLIMHLLSNLPALVLLCVML